MTYDTNSAVEICALLANYTTYSDNSLPMYRTNYRSHLQGYRIWKEEEGPITCPKMYVKNYLYRLHNFPEHSIYYLLHGTSLKSCRLNRHLISLCHSQNSGKKQIYFTKFGSMNTMQPTSHTFKDHRYVYYLTSPTCVGLLGHLQGYHSNTTRRFSRLLYW